MASRPIPAAAEAEGLRQKLALALRSHDDVVFAYLFGSHAKGRARAASDVDLALFLEPGSSRGDRIERALRIEAALEAQLGTRVQAAVLNDAPIELRRNVLGHGIPIVCRDHGARRAFYLDTGKRYYDQAYARELFTRYRDRRLREGRFGG